MCVGRGGTIFSKPDKKRHVLYTSTASPFYMYCHILFGGTYYHVICLMPIRIARILFRNKYTVHVDIRGREAARATFGLHFSFTI